MRLGVLLASSAAFALSTISLQAQEIFSGPPLGMCPDASPEEAEAVFKKVPVPEPRIEDRDGFNIEGIDTPLAGHEQNTFLQIPKSWSTLMQALPNIQNAIRAPGVMADGSLPPPGTYALCFGGDPQKFHFLPGVEVFVLQPPKFLSGFVGVVVPPNRYAVFGYEGSAAGTGDFRWSVQEFMKASNYVRRNDPNFEVYSPGINAMAETIKMEFWVPIER